jgi:hypothetical protein
LTKNIVAAPSTIFLIAIFAPGLAQAGSVELKLSVELPQGDPLNIMFRALGQYGQGRTPLTGLCHRQ